MTKRPRGRTKSGQYVFKRHDKIGAVDAFEDKLVLRNCFVDTGTLDILRDTEKYECVVLGRTGAGKTALLEMLKEREEQVVQLDPDDLALTYLSNATALKFYEEVGVNLDLYYRFLWKHIFVIEIVRAYFNDETKLRAFLTSLATMSFRSRKSQRARDYVRLNDQEFWLETEHRITERTQKLEQALNKEAGAALKAKLPGLGSGDIHLDINAANQLSVEDKAEIKQLGQPVVAKDQMRELNEVLGFLDEVVLTDRQKRCYITVDKLDVQWASDDLRYRLIRALLEVTRDINQRLSTVKIILALREDLFKRIFRYTHQSGDQEEKYVSLCLPVRWTEKDLEECLNLRVNQLVRDQYAGDPIGARELLPPSVDKKTKDTLQYFLDRTLLMPRDVIMFFNECIQQAAGRTKINKTQFLAAEVQYSERRLRALRDEWSADYPNLLQMAKILRNKNSSFQLGDFEENETKAFLTDFLTIHHEEPEGYLYQLVMEELTNEETGYEKLLRDILKIFYRVGIIGIKQEAYLKTYWSYQGEEVFAPDIDATAKFSIHPAFWRILGIKTI